MTSIMSIMMSSGHFGDAFSNKWCTSGGGDTFFHSLHIMSRYDITSSMMSYHIMVVLAGAPMPCSVLSRTQSHDAKSVMSHYITKLLMLVQAFVQ